MYDMLVTNVLTQAINVQETFEDPKAVNPMTDNEMANNFLYQRGNQKVENLRRRQHNIARNDR